MSWQDKVARVRGRELGWSLKTNGAYSRMPKKGARGQDFEGAIAAHAQKLNYSNLSEPSNDVAVTEEVGAHYRREC